MKYRYLVQRSFTHQESFFSETHKLPPYALRTGGEYMAGGGPMLGIDATCEPGASRHPTVTGAAPAAIDI